MRDLSHNIGTKLAVAPAIQTASVNGLSIDTKDFGSLAFVIATGAIDAAGVFNAKIQESDTGTSGWTDVDPELVTGAFASPLAANSTTKAGYVGYKRFARVVLTKGTGTSLVIGAVAVQDHAIKRPVA